ncbi:MAG: hypothetical protein DMF69_08925 [Acidobacteria bacterium]|nr:MAG: hypothetical protein DMF69_08925 [Acidobacteriota bacterium]
MWVLVFLEKLRLGFAACVGFADVAMPFRTEFHSLRLRRCKCRGRTQRSGFLQVDLGGRSAKLAGDLLRKGTATSSQQAAKPFTLELILVAALLRCASAVKRAGT